MLPEIRYKARKKIIKTEIRRDKGVADTLLEAENVHISRIYRTHATGLPCLNAVYYVSRPENCVAFLF